MKVIEVTQPLTMPGSKKRLLRVAFAAESVSSVREVLNIRKEDDGLRTKIVFRGDLYEHHVVETDEKLLGWEIK